MMRVLKSRGAVVRGLWELGTVRGVLRGCCERSGGAENSEESSEFVRDPGTQGTVRKALRGWCEISGRTGHCEEGPEKL